MHSVRYDTLMINVAVVMLVVAVLLIFTALLVVTSASTYSASAYWALLTIVCLCGVVLETRTPSPSPRLIVGASAAFASLF